MHRYKKSGICLIFCFFIDFLYYVQTPLRTVLWCNAIDLQSGNDRCKNFIDNAQRYKLWHIEGPYLSIFDKVYKN